MKKILLKDANLRLFLIWLVGGFLLSIPIIFYLTNPQITNNEKTEDVWAIVLQGVWPVVTLLGGGFVAVKTKLKKGEFVDRNFYLMAMIVSVSYLLIVALLFFRRVTAGMSFTELYNNNKLFLSIAQSVITGILGLFLLKRE